MIETYLVDIVEPIQIPAVVYELKQRGIEKHIRVFLNHTEKANIVRGNAQKIHGDLGVVEIKRPDGGKTWYHGKTKCMMEARPIETSKGFDVKKEINLWGEKIIELISEYHREYQNLQFINSDVYTQEGIQIVGASGHLSNKVFTTRSCWYDSDPLEDVIQLLKVDKTEEEIQHFLKSFGLLSESFFPGLLKLYGAKKVLAQDFISKSNLEEALKLQNFKSGHIIGSCIGSGYP